jgi:serine/threonine-protein kinase
MTDVMEGGGGMTAAQARRISAICDQFELDWRIGEPPNIEDYLARAQPEDRAMLEEDLVRVNQELRQAGGEQSSTVDYQGPGGEPEGGIERGARAASRGPGEPPPIVGNYVLMEQLGAGGQGVVFRARKIGLVPHEVAIKLIPAWKLDSRAAVDRFIEEVQILEGLRHDHIVPVLDSGEDRGQPYCVMQLMSGSSLAKTLKARGEPFAPDDAARLVQQVAEAVAYLHERGVLHCDLKPSNILIDHAGKPSVADFGLARALGPDGGAALGRKLFGTIPYLPPEQVDGHVVRASDIYSLGVILFELLTGRLPFPRSEEAILSIREREPPSPRSLRVGIPPDLELICLKCLRKDPGDRYDSAAQLAEELDRFRQDLPLKHTPPATTWQHVQHWARSEPALAARLAVIVACSVIIWAYPLITGHFAPLLPDHWAIILSRSGRGVIDWSNTAVLVWANQLTLIAWGLASWGFQRRLNRRGQFGGLQLGWRAVDVIVLALIIKLDDALMSPLTVAFAVLIVASGFWARADQIIQTTLLSMAAYCALILDFRNFHLAQDRPYRHFHYLVGLLLLAAMLRYQANRTRALARICGERHLP